jgi:hypothetical protein
MLGVAALRIIATPAYANQPVTPEGESVARALAASRGTGRLRWGSYGRDDRPAGLEGWSAWRGRACHLLMKC